MKYFTASTHKRLVAHMIDNLVMAAFYSPIMILGYSSFQTQGAFMVPWKVVLTAVSLEFFFKVFFYYFCGASLGKLVMGLRLVPASLQVVNKDLSLVQCFLRAMADRLSFFFSHALRAMAFLRLDRRHFSDWVAETRVVQLFPRPEPARRRFFVFILIFVFSLVNGFQSANEILTLFSFNPEYFTLLEIPVNW